MHPNTMKHTKRWVWAPMGWIRMFVAKNYNMTSWHELLHLLHQFSMFCNKFHVVTKRSQMHPNATKWTETLASGPMGWIWCVRCEKSWRDFVARTFALLAPVHPVLHRVSSSYETIPNAPKQYETHQIMILGSNGVDQVCSLWKITTWLRGTNF